MTAPVIFTIVSANYLAYATTLMQTVREHHPDALRFVVLADEDPGTLDLDADLFSLVPARALGLPHFEHFAFRYSVLEFNTAIKPFAAAWLAEAHPSSTIVYLDPDIFVVSPMVEVLTLAEGALAVVTPHLTAPYDDDKRPDELSIMRAGAYNLGFIAIGAHPDRAAFLKWWSARLEFGARVDFEAGLFNDQKWIDLVPGMFPDVAVLRAPGYNLAYWNLPHRPVSINDGTLLAGGQPVSFIHFSGVDIHDPDRFSKHQNRFRRSSIGALRPTYDRYLARLLANGHERYLRIPFAWARLDDGTVITNEIRAIFRDRHDVGRPDERADPFGMSGQSLVQKVPPMSQLSRRFLELYPRLRASPPIRAAIDRVGPRTRWAARRFLTRRAALPGSAGSSNADYPSSRPTGLESHPRANVIGYFQGEFGVAEAARSLVRAADTAGVEVALVNVRAPEAGREDDNSLRHRLGAIAPHPINLICVNADQVGYVMGLLGDRVTDGRHNIGRWFWELSSFPAAWAPSLELVDEVWAPTEFVRNSIQSSTTKPVRTVPPAIHARPLKPYQRSTFAIPDDAFAFLFSFDFKSFTDRKNPLGLLRAFAQAFPRGDEHTVLVLKTTNGSADPTVMEHITEAAAADSRVRLLNGFMSRDEMFGLESVVDAYVSLHRSEGFGLGLAESMSLGKPVIATGYSGNMDFMNAGNSCIVSYEMVDIPAGRYPHCDGATWADPDLDHAAYFMRRLAADESFASRLGESARRTMSSSFSAAAVGERVAKELERVLRQLGDE